MGTCWHALDDVLRAVIQLQLGEQAANSESEQQQFAAAAAKLETAWQANYDSELKLLNKAIVQLKRQQSQELEGTDWQQVASALASVRQSGQPKLDANGKISSMTAAEDALRQTELLQSGAVLNLHSRLSNHISKLERHRDKVRDRYYSQDSKYDEWWEYHSQLVMCHDNAKYAQQLHQELEPQIRQQLAALPNLSSLHIVNSDELPPGLADGVLQLGSQLTKLELGTVGGLNRLLEAHLSTKPFMPQQLDALCCQLTNVQQLQWDEPVDDDGMRSLLKLPRLQHVTMVTNLSQSFADAECSWHSLTTMHRSPDCKNGNSTCKQLSCLPLKALQQPVMVLRTGWFPQVFAMTDDTAADLAVAQQACRNVARCGGIAWEFRADNGCKFPGCLHNIPSIHFMPYAGSKEVPTPNTQQVQLLAAALPVLRERDMHVVSVHAYLDAAVLSVIARQLGEWCVKTLDITHCHVVPELAPYLLGFLPASIHHLIIRYRMRPIDEWQAWSRFSKESLMRLCAGAIRPITISVLDYDDVYGEEDFAELQQEVAAASSHIQLEVLDDLMGVMSMDK